MHAKRQLLEIFICCKTRCTATEYESVSSVFTLFKIIIYNFTLGKYIMFNENQSSPLNLGVSVAFRISNRDNFLNLIKTCY